MFFRKKKYISSSSLSRLAWKRFNKSKLSVFSMYFITAVIIIAILGYLITPDSTPYANTQFLELTAKKPGFSVEMLRLRKNEKPVEGNILKEMMFGQRKNFTSIPINNYHFEGQNIIIEEYNESPATQSTRAQAYNMADVVYPLSNIDPDITFDNNSISFNNVHEERIKVTITDLKQDIRNKFIVRETFFLGTDRYGRDLLSQLMIGARVSLSVGFISVTISLLIGILLGSIAGFFRGWIDDIIIWFINVVWSIPTLLLVIAISFALGKGFWQVFIAVGLTMWVEVARVVRGQILSIREKEFVEAGRALGFGNARIIFRHILPNVMGAVIVISAANFAAAILIEAGLSFLGIGVQPPMPSWGTMIKENYGYIILDSAYLAILPGIAIILMVLAFMLMGNGLRDALDVRTVD